MQMYQYHTQTHSSYSSDNQTIRLDVITPVITFDDKLELSQEIYVRFAGTDGQTPFYHIDDDTVEIPKCTIDNFGKTSSTLRENAEICYGKSDSDTILVSKILAIFGIAS